jgi:SAM-dependent methyltransferase
MRLPLEIEPMATRTATQTTGCDAGSASPLSRWTLPMRAMRDPSRYLKRASLFWQTHISLNGSFNDESLVGMASIDCPHLWQELLNQFQPQSILDVGCGTGRALDFFCDHGVRRTVGLEGSKLLKRHARCPEQILLTNLNRLKALREKFDLVFSFEVAEHIHPRYVENYVTTLTSHGDHVVLSAAPPGQGGHLHWNEQPPQYWIERITKRGFTFDPATAERLQLIPNPHCTNLMVFSR